MRIDDILNMDIDKLSRMNRRELAKVVSQLSSSANKRLRRLEQQGLTDSYAYNKAQTVGDFSVKGKNTNQLRKEFARVRDFINSKTSSVKGYKKFLGEVSTRVSGGNKSIGKKVYGDLGLRKQFWSVYNRVKESYPSLFGSKGDSTRMQELIALILADNADKSDDDIMNIVRENINNLYEKTEADFEKRENEIEENDAFFDVWQDFADDEDDELGW